MADEFDTFLNAGGGEQDSGISGAVFDAGLGALDAAADWLFGEDEDNTVFGIGDSGGGGMMAPSAGFGFGDIATASASPQAQQAAMSIVAAIMSSDVIGSLARNMLDRLPGVIFDAREPAYNGSPLTQAMLSILFRKLSKNEQEAVVERLAGGETPISDSNSVRKVFRVLYVYDALRALNEADAARAIFYGQK